MTIRLTVDGVDRTVDCDPLRRLVDVLRLDLGRTDVKEGCGEGECGACTVLFGGRPVCSCTLSAVQADGAVIETPAAIAATPEGRLLADCFDETSAVQCGFCFPGILVSAYHYLVADVEVAPERIREALSGHICRCTGYQRIVESVLLACCRARGGGCP